MGGFLWSIEPDGTLYKTSKTGQHERIGPRGAFSDVTLLAAMGGKLWTIENGTLSSTDPARP